MTESNSFRTGIYTGSYAIPKLDNDILWSIFSLNADMEQETEENLPALLTLRNTSQVCSKWRVLAIGTPSLWARVLNFNLLSQKGNKWRKEVFRRTGTVPLHIRAVDRKQVPLGDRNSLEWMLNEYWTRIQSLEIRLNWKPFTEDEDRWTIFERPAPSLEYFVFSWEDGPWYFTDPNFVLFDNAAPSLRTLDTSHMIVDLTAISFPNLRNLASHSQISAFDFLGALSRLPILESLEMLPSGIREMLKPLILVGDKQKSLQHVTLPRLKSIKFFGLDGVDIALSFLAHIIPANGCTLDFHGCYSTKSPTSTSLELYRHILSTYSQYCTELATAKNLEVTLDDESCMFEVALPYNRCFKFGIGSGRFVLPKHTVSTLGDALSGLRLDQITMLGLDLENINATALEYLANLILALVSVERLDTNCKTLKVLKVIQSNAKVATFPTLKNIYLGSVYKLPGITGFLDSRLKRGAANTFTIWMKPASGVDLKPLNKYHGLTVQIYEGTTKFEEF